jgi:hypothetical protein
MIGQNLANDVSQALVIVWSSDSSVDRSLSKLRIAPKFHTSPPKLFSAKSF